MTDRRNTPMGFVCCRPKIKVPNNDGKAIAYEERSMGVRRPTTVFSHLVHPYRSRHPLLPPRPRGLLCNGHPRFCRPRSVDVPKWQLLIGWLFPRAVEGFYRLPIAAEDDRTGELRCLQISCVAIGDICSMPGISALHVEDRAPWTKVKTRLPT